MSDQPIQNFYADSICFGCGRDNRDGLHVQTYWDGDEGLCRFTPKAQHSAFPGFVYGGILASLIDCHSIGTATAATFQAEGRDPGSEPEIAYVTGNLNVSYLQPTPLGPELILRARIKELTPRKAIVTCSVYTGETECVRGEVVAVRVRSREKMRECDKLP